MVSTTSEELGSQIFFHSKFTHLHSKTMSIWLCVATAVYSVKEDSHIHVNKLLTLFRICRRHCIGCSINNGIGFFSGIFVLVGVSIFHIYAICVGRI